MKVDFKIFTGTLETQKQLCRKAAAFASEIGQKRLINISQSFAHTRATVTVWFWEI